jgi:hypothetical protein
MSPHLLVSIFDYALLSLSVVFMQRFTSTQFMFDKRSQIPLIHPILDKLEWLPCLHLNSINHLT